MMNKRYLKCNFEAKATQMAFSINVFVLATVVAGVVHTRYH